MGLLRRQPAIVAFTVVEVVGLTLWLGVVDGTISLDPVSVGGTTVPVDVFGLAILFAALVVKHDLTAATVRRRRFRLPKVNDLVVSASETMLWGVWLVVADAVGGLLGIAVAGVLLAAVLVPQHSIEDGALRGRGLFSNVFDLGTLGFSIVEAAGASIWLVLVRFPELAEEVGVIEQTTAQLGLEPALLGLAVFAVFLFVEHNMGVRFARRGISPTADATGSLTSQ